MERARKIINIIYIVVFLSVLILPLVFMDTKANVESEIDNRMLNEAPEIGDPDYFNNFKSYFSDRIGFRNTMVKAYGILNDVFFNDLTHPLYTYGKDDYIFFKMHNKIEYNDFHKSFAEMALKVQQYCEERGTKFYFIFDPEKSSIYRRYLPDGVNYNDNWVKQMISYMQEIGVNCVDNTDMLMEKSYEEQVFNVQYDAGHWNDLGCFYATNELLKVIHEDFPEVNELSKDQFEITQKQETTLPVSEFPINEMVPSFELKTSWSNISADYIDEIETNPSFKYFHYLVNEAEGAESLPKVLFFQGSYYNRGPQFLISQTSEYIGVHNYQNIFNIDYYYNLFNPEIVILDAAEYVFDESYFDYETMKYLDLNPALIKATEDYATQIDEIKAKSTKIDEQIYINQIVKDKTNKTIIDKQIDNVKYAYLLCNNNCYDLSNDFDGVVYADLQNNVDLSNAIVVYITRDEEMFYFEPKTRVLDDNKLVFEESKNSYITGDSILLTSKNKKSIFSSVDLQLFNAETGEYLDTIASGTYSQVRGLFSFNYDSGFYIIRFKANSNIEDEYVETIKYLYKNEVYYYQYQIDKITRKNVVFSDCKFIGLSKEIKLIPFIEEFICSDGAKKTGNYIEMKTSIEGNNFGSLDFQIYDEENSNYLGTAFTAYQGKVIGTYLNELETGLYTLRIKGNSNMHDEYVYTKIQLTKGQTYFILVDVEALYPKLIKISSLKMYVFEE